MNIKKIWIKYNRLTLGAILFFAFVLSAIFAPYVATHDPLLFNMQDRMKSPSAEHLCGTDAYGRDIFSRIVFGTRVSLTIALSVLVLCGVFGTIFGLLAGYYKWADALIMRVMDGLMAFPSILLALVILAALGAGIQNIILALTITHVPRVTRTVRSTAISIKEFEHVEAAKAMGASDARIIFKYILPLCVSPLIVRLTLMMAVTILSEATLTFLGVGLSPEIPSWGNSLSEGRQYITTSPYMILYPGIAIVLSVVSLNMMGDSLRDILDPRLNSN
ncbi:MAG: ABC transporter permease [Desulfitobacteriaceae bacterium]|nr:ABC transporter permease [Desulfitobacteriaceae bacterium]MDD4401894.1 ABC transporter permease [Desulfitobacteriaceae bacterium]